MKVVITRKHDETTVEGDIANITVERRGQIRRDLSINCVYGQNEVRKTTKFKRGSHQNQTFTNVHKGGFGVIGFGMRDCQQIKIYHVYQQEVNKTKQEV